MKKQNLKKDEVTLNKKQGLYVIPEGGGYSCLGFDVLIKRRDALAKELDFPGLAKEKRGTMKAYIEYRDLIRIASKKHDKTGWRSASELNEKLIGLEGKRVEAITENGEKMRFIVGRSTGFIPVHLEIKTSRSSGGGAIHENFKSVKVVDHSPR